jgi:hypothetical protein
MQVTIDLPIEVAQLELSQLVTSLSPEKKEDLLLKVFEKVLLDPKSSNDAIEAKSKEIKGRLQAQFPQDWRIESRSEYKEEMAKFQEWRTLINQAVINSVFELMEKRMIELLKEDARVQALVDAGVKIVSDDFPNIVTKAMMAFCANNLSRALAIPSLMLQTASCSNKLHSLESELKNKGIQLNGPSEYYCPSVSLPPEIDPEKM